MKTHFSERLKTLRISRGFSRDRLADEAIISIDQIRHWERGTSEPKIEYLIRLKNTLRCTWFELMGE